MDQPDNEVEEEGRREFGDNASFDVCSLGADEICRLLKHSIEKGYDLSDVNVPLLDAYANGLIGPQDRIDVMEAYTTLCKITYPVHGRSLKESENVLRTGRLRWLPATAVVFLAFAIGNELIELWADAVDVDFADEGFLVATAKFQNYILDPLSPLAWAGLGSCVYLLKHFTDIAADLRFDQRLLQGWRTRITLGAVLGGVITYIFQPDFLTGTEFDANGIAFLSGLGVKVVYGSLEKLVNELASRFNLGKPKKATLTDMLVQKLDKTDQAKNKKLYDALTTVIREIDR